MYTCPTCKRVWLIGGAECCHESKAPDIILDLSIASGASFVFTLTAAALGEWLTSTAPPRVPDDLPALLTQHFGNTDPG